MDLNDIFAEEEARLSAEYRARVESGEEDRAIAKALARGQAEWDRLVLNDAIERHSDDEEDEEE